jgi:hypothetical protein
MNLLLLAACRSFSKGCIFPGNAATRSGSSSAAAAAAAGVTPPTAAGVTSAAAAADCCGCCCCWWWGWCWWWGGGRPAAASCCRRGMAVAMFERSCASREFSLLVTLRASSTSCSIMLASAEGDPVLARRVYLQSIVVAIDQTSPLDLLSNVPSLASRLPQVAQMSVHHSAV